MPIDTALDIRCFIIAAEELNIRRAAERLGIPQPSLTRQILSLEARIGFDLLIRDRGRITGLTAAGASYLNDARRLLRMSDNAIRSARDIAEGKAGRLRLGICEDATTSKLGRILDAFGKSLPGVGFDLLELPSADQAAALRHNEIDLGIVASPVDERDLVIEPLWQEDWYVAFSFGHQLAQLDCISCAHLAQATLILPDPELAPGGHDHVRSAFLSAGIRPNIGIRAQRRSTMIILAASGAGVTFVPAAVASTVSLPGVAFRPFVSEPLTIAAAFRANDPPGLAMQFLRTAHDMLETSAQTGRL